MCYYHLTSFFLLSICLTQLPSTESEHDEIPDSSIPCDNGWFLFGEKCYKIFGKNSEWMNWHKASHICASHGGHLATVNSQEVQDFLVVFLLMDADASAWIGLHDRINETQYEWEDGTPFNYSKWNKNEPSEWSNSREDCVQMVFRVPVGELGEWNDNSCIFKLLPYICQVDKGKQGRISPNLLECPSAVGGGRRYRNSCYNVISERKSWKDAEKYCQETYNGHLVMILDIMFDYFLEYIMSNFSNDIWIGMKMKEQFQQQFSSGWYAAYSNWHNTSQSFVENTCVIRTKEKVWEAVSCEEKYPFICEVSADSPPALKKPVGDSRCPNTSQEWRDFGGEFCYFIDTANYINWYQANYECSNRGGHLASIHSKEELDVLAPFTETIKPVADIQRRMFIGFYRSKEHEKVFEWVDGSSMDFANWDILQPDNLLQKCGELLPRSMKFNDVYCHERKGYICSVKKIPTNARTPEPDSYTQPSTNEMTSDSYTQFSTNERTPDSYTQFSTNARTPEPDSYTESSTNARTPELDSYTQNSTSVNATEADLVNYNSTSGNTTDYDYTADIRQGDFSLTVLKVIGTMASVVLIVFLVWVVYHRYGPQSNGFRRKLLKETDVPFDEL